MPTGFSTPCRWTSISRSTTPGSPRGRSKITAVGDLHLGGPEGAVFDRFAISVSDFDLRSVGLVSPAVRLNGHAQLVGTLNGPWKNVMFDGRVEHHEGAAAVSAIQGRVETRYPRIGCSGSSPISSSSPSTSMVSRGSFPALTLRGQLAGHVQTSGDLSHLGLNMDVRGQLGAVKAVGTVTVEPPRLGATVSRWIFPSRTSPRSAAPAWLPTSMVTR